MLVLNQSLLQKLLLICSFRYEKSVELHLSSKKIHNSHHAIVRAVNGLSYNQLVEKIIANKNNTDNNLVTESLVAQNFLEESASQLTYHGLCELGTTMKENELAIFFRNNHFSTIHKRNNVRYFYDLLLYFY